MLKYFFHKRRINFNQTTYFLKLLVLSLATKDKIIPKNAIKFFKVRIKRGGKKFCRKLMFTQKFHYFHWYGHLQAQCPQKSIVLICIKNEIIHLIFLSIISFLQFSKIVIFHFDDYNFPIFLLFGRVMIYKFYLS